MKIKRIFTLFFSFSTILICSQSIDSVKVIPNKKHNFFAGTDVLNGAVSAFSDKKLFQGFVSFELKKDLYAVIDAGFSKNIYTKSSYDAQAQGFFAKLGAVYMLSEDYEDRFNGFYAGGKLGASFYKQHYIGVPIRGYQGVDEIISFPESSQSSYWAEAAVGARVRLFRTHFFIDVNIQPRYLLFTTKQDEIFPMTVPGFGQSSGRIAFGFSWNIAYLF